VKTKPSKSVRGAAHAAPAVKAGPMAIHVLSDSTGNLAHHMLTAFLTQFPGDAFTLHRHNFLKTSDDVARAMEAMAAGRGIVFHAFVSPDFKKIVAERCAASGVACCDLTGQFVSFLAEQSGIQPRPNLQKLHDTTDEYHRRIQALEFTLEHDDGLGLETIHQADAVLAGVSRTSKTPTSVYLAQQGYRVANVALAQGVDPPRELLKLPSHKVIGLYIYPTTLADIRTHRQASWHMGDTRYNNPETVQQEVAWSRKLFASKGWKTLDVTDQAIEETSARIVNILNLPKPGPT